MGATASISSLPSLTVEQVGDLVAGCGDAYVPYRGSLIDAGIDGQFLQQLDEQNIQQQFVDLGFRDELHIKTLSHRLLQSKYGKTGELPADCSVAKNDFELRGVTIALFRAVAKEALERNHDKSYWNMGRVSADSSLIEMLKTAHHEIPHFKLGVTYRQVVGTKANIFLSFAYGDNFIDLVEGLELFMEDEKRNPTTTYFWFDMFVNDQWHALDHDFDWWANTFSTAVESIGETVIFLSPWGADREKADANDFTPLHGAALMTELEAAKLLMVYGADLNARTSEATHSLLPIDMPNASEEIRQAIRDEPRRRMDEAPGKRATEEDRHPTAATSASVQDDEAEEGEQSNKRPRLDGGVAEEEGKVAEEDEDSEPSDGEEDA